MSSKNLERLIKREIYGKPQSVRLTAAPGWLAELEAELRQVLTSFSLASKFSPVLKPEEQAIEVSSIDFRNLIELPLRMQTAADIRWSLRARHVGSFGEFQDFLEKCPWDFVLPPGAPVHIKVESYRSKLFHEGKLADMIREHLQSCGYRIQDQGGIRLVFEQIENRHEVFVCLTQDPLFHRGYKAQLGHRAPLQEHLAASAIQRFFSLPAQKDWLPELSYVPFAGSGTLWSESMIAMLRIPLHNWRNTLGIEQWPCFPLASWQQIERRLLKVCEEHARELKAVLLEKDPLLAENLKGHSHRLVHEGKLQFLKASMQIVPGDFFEYELDHGIQKVFVPLNPPYGIRLEHGEAQGHAMEPAQFYRKLGERLSYMMRQNQDMRGFVLVPDPESLKSFTQALGEEHITDVHHFSQGGQHIRSLSFRSKVL